MRNDTVVDVYEYGGMFGPISVMHEAIIEWLLQEKKAPNTVINVRFSADREDKPDNAPLVDRMMLGRKVFHDIENDINIVGEEFLFIPTVYRLRVLQEQYPNARIHFVCGMDPFLKFSNNNGHNASSISTWDESEDLLENHHFIIFDREDEEGKLSDRSCECLDMPKHYELASLKTIQCSSSEIRNSIAEGRKDWRALVNPIIASDLLVMYAKS